MPPPSFEIRLDTSCKCQRCGRPRELPEQGEAETILSGNGVTVVRTAERCACGHDRVAIRARVMAG